MHEGLDLRAQIQLPHFVLATSGACDAGAASALFVYRGKAGEELLCQMFAGRVASLPAGAERRENKGIEFYVYRSGGKTAVFWQEGAIVCVLVSDIAPEKVVQLAFAKAMIP